MLFTVLARVFHRSEPLATLVLPCVYIAVRCGCGTRIDIDVELYRRDLRAFKCHGCGKSHLLLQAEVNAAPAMFIDEITDAELGADPQRYEPLSEPQVITAIDYAGTASDRTVLTLTVYIGYDQLTAVQRAALEELLTKLSTF